MIRISQKHMVGETIHWLEELVHMPTCNISSFRVGTRGTPYRVDCCGFAMPYTEHAYAAHPVPLSLLLFLLNQCNTYSTRCHIYRGSNSHCTPILYNRTLDNPIYLDRSKLLLYPAQCGRHLGCTESHLYRPRRDLRLRVQAEQR